MQTINLWNKLHLYGQKIAIAACLVMVFMTSSALGQNKKINLPKHDDNPLRFGFQLAAHMFDLRVRHTGGTGIMAVSHYSPGFSLGFTVNKALRDQLWDLRVTPTVAFNTRKVLFAPPRMGSDTANTAGEEAALGQTFIELPIMLKYKSLRRGNSRFYMTAGVIPSMEVGGKKAKDNPEEFLLKRQNLEVCYGLGFESFMKMFKLAPEVRFSHGLLNIAQINQYPNIGVVNKFTSHRISFIFNFE